MLDIQRPWPKPISVSIAAGRADVVPETIVRWCKRDGIGKQLRPKAPWRVDPVGLAIVMAGDGEALALFQSGDMTNSKLGSYVEMARLLGARRIQ